MEWKQEALAQTTIAAFEQRIEAGGSFDGTVPKKTVNYVYYFDSDKSLYSAKHPSTPDTAYLCNTAGLFSFGNQKPILLRQIIADLGAATCDWTLSLVTDLSTVEILRGTSVKQVNYFDPQKGLVILPGEKLKFTSTTAVAAYVRIYVTLARFTG